MLHTKVPSILMQRGVVERLRFQLVVVLTCGVFLPGWIMIQSLGVRTITRHGTINSLAAATLAAVMLVGIVRRIGQYPGATVAESVFPVLGGLYGVLLAFLAAFRLEYSNKLLLFSFIGTLATRYIIAAIEFRGRPALFCLVPGGRVGMIHSLANVATIELSTPCVPPIPDATFVADLHFDHDSEWERFLAEAALSGRPVYHFKQVWEANTGKVQIDHISENGFGAIVPSLSYQKAKRSIDLFACALVLPLVLPVLAIVAGLIKLYSTGPAFFSQKRVGFRGQIFNVLKFRTMTVTHDGDTLEDSITHASDQRITKIGRILRRLRIDELPQILNIIKGDMSWIGPRPEAVSLSMWYEQEIPFYRYRHIVRPGITGWAQVNQGHVASLKDVHGKLQYDFFYVKNLSYWLDILIAFRTVRVILTGFGVK